MSNDPLPFFCCTDEKDVDTDLWHCRNAVLEQYVYDKARAEKAQEEIMVDQDVWWMDCN